ncbi:MAG: hypothetical protein AMXMBFR57_12950 [Acidimicrobiia bacterium]
MESVDAKLRRAHYHLTDLTKGLLELGREHRPVIVLKSDAQHVWVVVYFKDPYAALTYGTVFGDFLYNLRSALDAMIHALVQKAGGTPNWKTCFPIYENESSYERKTKQGTKEDVLAGVPVDARRLVKGLQPFMRGGSSSELDPLHLLNVLCNQDKHRATHIMVGYSKEVRFALHRANGEVVHFASEGPLIGHGPWLIPVPMPVELVEPNHRIQTAGSSDFLLRSDDSWQGRSVLDLAHTLIRYVEEKVIVQFKPFFERAG